MEKIRYAEHKYHIAFVNKATACVALHMSDACWDQDKIDIAADLVVGMAGSFHAALANDTSFNFIKAHDRAGRVIAIDKGGGFRSPFVTALLPGLIRLYELFVGEPKKLQMLDEVPAWIKTNLPAGRHDDILSVSHGMLRAWAFLNGVFRANLSDFVRMSHQKLRQLLSTSKGRSFQRVRVLTNARRTSSSVICINLSLCTP